MAETPNPTAKDRATLERRVKAGLAKNQLDPKSAEDRLGRPRGTLARVYHGHKRVDAALLRDLARVLDTAPEALTAGTRYEAVLGGKVETRQATGSKATGSKATAPKAEHRGPSAPRYVPVSPDAPRQEPSTRRPHGQEREAAEGQREGGVRALVERVVDLFRRR